MDIRKIGLAGTLISGLFLPLNAAQSTDATVPRPADLKRGGMLYENHCMQCHESIVHIREQQQAESLGDIAYQILRWERELRLKWSADEVYDVMHYLNHDFYHFSAQP